MGQRYWPDKMSTVGFILTVFGALDFFCTSFADPYVMPKLMPILAGLIIIWLARARDKFSFFWVTPLDLSLCTFAAVMAVTTYFSIDRYNSLVGQHLSQFHSCLAFLVLIGAYLAGSMFASPARAARIMLLLAIPVCFYGISQHCGFDPLAPFPMPDGRIIGTQGGPVYLGAVLAVLVPLAAGVLESDHTADILLGLPSLGLLPLTIYLTGTRGAGIAAVVGLCVYMYLRHGWRASTETVLLGIGLVVLMVHSRLGAGGSDGGRLEVWRSALQVWLAHPWIGTGPDTFNQASRQFISPAFIAAQHSSTMQSPTAHNDFLQVLATMGMAGFAAYIAVLAGVVKMVRDSYKAWLGHRSDYAREVAAMVGGAAAALFVVAKVNPVPLSAMVLVALMVGTLSVYSKGYIIKIGRAVPLTGALVLAGLLGVCIQISRGEAWQREAVRRSVQHDFVGTAMAFNRASYVNRWDMFAAKQEVTYLLAAVRATVPQDRAGMLDIAVATAKRAVRWHPCDPDAYELLGRSLVMRGIYTGQGRVGDAMDAYEKARILAPTFPGILWPELALAQFAHDRPRAEALAHQLDLIHSKEETVQ